MPRHPAQPVFSPCAGWDPLEDDRGAALLAVTPLSQAIMAGMDPSVYRPLSDIDTGRALTQAGMDASPTSKWGALGRVAQALAGTYISGGAQSELAKTITEGKKSAAELWIKKQLALAPSAPPRSEMPAPGSRPQPAVQPNMPDQPQAETPAAPSTEGFDPQKFAEIAKAQAARVDEPSIPLGAPMPAPTAPAALAAPAPMPDAVAAIDRATQPRGIRNNNPLNIEAGDFTKGQPGFAGSDGRFARFETPEHGVAAANRLLDIYEQKHGLNTVAGIIGRWAPTADGNNVSAYAANVAGRLGIDPNAPVPKEMRPQLIAAMAQHENGKAAPGTVDAPYQVAGPAVAAPRATSTAAGAEERRAPAASADPTEGLGVSQLMQVLHHPWASDEEKALAKTLLVQRLTPKEDEFASSPQGIYNKRTGELKQGQNAGNDFGERRGKDLLAAVEKSDPSTASQVKAIIEGRTAYPTGSRLNPVQQRVKELVTLVDPTFETGNSGARMKVRNEFLAGGPNAPAGQITAGNTAIQHLGKLLEASDNLGGTGDYGVLNSPLNQANVAIKHSANNTHLVDYNNALGRFAEEATKFYRGVGGTEADIKRAIDDLTAAQSPEARKTAIKAQAELMASKINALQDRWKQGMGPLVDEFPIIHPESKQALEKINPPAGGNTKDGGDKRATGSGLKKISTQAEYDALPAGTPYIAPNGKEKVKGGAR